MHAHDNRLIGYAVDGRNRRIVLHTEDVHGQNPPRFLDVVFEGVEFYQFRCAALVSIVLEILEQPLRRALEGRSAELDEAYRRCGWPDRWDHDPSRRETDLRELEARGLRFFEIESSMGFEGWVVAERFDYVAAASSP
jgi:hypothetical protein